MKELLSANTHTVAQVGLDYLKVTVTGKELDAHGACTSERLRVR